MNTRMTSMRRHLTAWLAILGVLAFAIIVGCATPRPSAPADPAVEVGLASYYADRFHGRRTASGERYDRNALTAAHRGLPFGARVRVTNLNNGRSVTVRINDRGPFVPGRMVDLSYAAAEKLGMLRAGVIKVRVERVD